MKRICEIKGCSSLAGDDGLCGHHMFVVNKGQLNRTEAQIERASYRLFVDDCVKTQRIDGEYVYFVGCCDAVKIGVSDNIKRRIGEMERVNPHKLVLHAYIRCTKKKTAYDLERHLHERFTKHHLRYEWFRFHFHVFQFLAKPSYKGQPIVTSPALRYALMPRSGKVNKKDLESFLRSFN